ncbi:MAG: peptide chain release factor 1 [Anaerolineales bacterium]|nr:MAG: peptide chain release factor 1 [Anaerolineales bacterium]
MLDKLAAVEARYEELNRLMADLKVATNPNLLRQYGQEAAELEELVQTYRRFRKVKDQLDETRAMLDDGLDDDMLGLVQDEIDTLEQQEAELTDQLEVLLIPRDPNDEKNVIVEIRAGTGGDEAGLFAADLYRMYARYAEVQNWQTQVLSSHPTGIGGFKEIIFEVQGRGAYSHLKYESGVHRVQRVPETEASGRIHTSTATVAVLPEMEEIEVEIDPNQIRVDVYRSQGAGGQSVNTTDSAVRITHLPTGMVVACQDERSQLQNKLRAMAILRSRLYEMEQERLVEEQGETRRSQVGSGERSEKIRTYNFPQNRITDHRIGFTSHRLETTLGGDLEELVQALTEADQAAKLREMASA